mgnify:CR=1 FL=1
MRCNHYNERSRLIRAVTYFLSFSGVRVSEAAGVSAEPTRGERESEKDENCTKLSCIAQHHNEILTAVASSSNKDDDQHDDNNYH